MKITDKFVFFWKAYIANWSITPHGLKTIINGQKVCVPTSEHLFMAFKAEFFKDWENLQNIVNSTTPREAKDFGRLIKNYNEEAWNNVRFNMMLKALTFRFEQDEKFAEQLMGDKFKDKEFVEASPIDRIWGIGLAETDPNIEDKSKWRGTNLLGQCLNTLRKNME